MNWRAVWAIYVFEMARTGRTIGQSIVAPVITTALYFIVFGAAIGSRIQEIEGVQYGAFIVPGLVMLSLLTQSVTNAAFGIYFPKFIGTIYELLSAPISPFEIVLGYVGAAASKSVIIGAIILVWAAGFEQLQFIPLLIITPLTFLGGTFYSISVLPPFWQTVTLFNPIVYLVSGYRWSFFEVADVHVGISLAMTVAF